MVWFGVFNIVGLVAGIVITSFLVPRFEHADNSKLARALLWLAVTLSISIVVFGFATSFALAAGAYLVARLARRLTEPLYLTWLNKNVEDSSVRATVNSMASQAGAVGEVAGGPAIGVVGTVASLRAALVATGLLLTPAIALYARAVRHGGRGELEEAERRPCEPDPDPRPLRERDFALFWLGWTVSLIGDGFFLVAIAWQVFDLWNSPTALAVVGVAETIPIVAFVLVGGVVADRFERRRVLIFSSALRGTAVGVLGVLAITGAVELWHIFVLSAFFGAGQAFQGPAAGAIIPDLVPRHLLVQANSLSQFVRQAAFAFVGPAVGGFVVHSVGAGTAFLVDAATFGFAIVTLLLTIPPRIRRLRGTDVHAAGHRRGLRYVRKHVWLWGRSRGRSRRSSSCTARGPCCCRTSSRTTSEATRETSGRVRGRRQARSSCPRRRPARPAEATHHVHVRLVADRVHPGRRVRAGRVPWQAMAIAFAGEGCWAGGLIVWVTLMQRVVPTELLGRVKSVDWLLSLGLVPLSFAVTGPLAGWLGVGRCS